MKYDKNNCPKSSAMKNRKTIIKPDIEPYQIIKQPNGLFSLWRNVNQTIIIYDANEEDIIKYFTNRYRVTLKKKIKQIVEDINNGKHHYGDDTISFLKALQQIQITHGDEAVNEILDGMKKSNPK